MDGVIMETIIRQTFTREDRIQQLKDACDCIKENAADFIGEEEFPQNWEISIVFECREFPVLRVVRESIPSITLKNMFDKT